MVNIAKTMLAAGAPMEAVLRRLRSESQSVIETANTIRAATGMSLREAKLLIDGSESWADQREAFRAIDAGALDAITNGDE